MKRTVCWGLGVRRLACGGREQRRGFYLVGIVLMHNPALFRRHILMTLALAAHGQRGIHVNVMAGQIQADEALEDHAVGGFGGGQEDEQARGSAAVGHHVQDGAEARALVVAAGGDAVEGVEQARDGVEEAAAARVQGHEVERDEGEDDADVAWRWGGMLATIAQRISGRPAMGRTDQIGHEEEDVLFSLLFLPLRDRTWRSAIYGATISMRRLNRLLLCTSRHFIGLAITAWCPALQIALRAIREVRLGGW